MPTYSYACLKCKKDFELFFYIKDYQPSPKCSLCGNNKTHRLYAKDVATQSASVKKADSELKTIGDLALRNTEKLSQDEKVHLYQKHNSYKENKEETKPLPSGMKRLNKPSKPIWPGSDQTNKKRRNVKK